MSGKTEMQVSLKVVPSEGVPTSQQVTVAPTGATVREVLEAACIDGKNKDFMVDGKPATLDTHIGPDSVVSAKDRGKDTVVVSERPRGS